MKTKLSNIIIQRVHETTFASWLDRTIITIILILNVTRGYAQSLKIATGKIVDHTKKFKCTSICVWSNEQEVIELKGVYWTLEFLVAYIR